MTDQPPHDALAEQSTLGAILTSPAAYTAVAEVIKAEHFYRPLHGEIFDAMTKLVSSGEPIDPVTLARELEKAGKLQRIGGGEYLLTLMQACPTAINAASYAKVVYDKWRQRQFIAAGERMKQLGYADATTSEDVDQLLGEADAIMRSLGDPARGGLMWDDLVEKWKNFKRENGDILFTPWRELNEWFPGGGFHVGQLVFVGGRPGNGKSNAGLNIALFAAEHDVRTTVFSVEMDDVEVCSRLLAAGSWAKFSQVYTKQMDPENKERVREYVEKRKGMPLEVVDQPYITVEKIIAHCRVHRPKVIFVDYAQLITATDNKLVREQQVAHITRSLKVAAKSLQMVVIVAAQLKRIDRVDRHGKEILPSISDLRESGAAEQDADIVILLHRPGESGQVTVIVGKNRNGPTGEVKLRFRGDMARIG